MNYKIKFLTFSTIIFNLQSGELVEAGRVPKDAQFTRMLATLNRQELIGIAQRYKEENLKQTKVEAAKATAFTKLTDSQTFQQQYMERMLLQSNTQAALIGTKCIAQIAGMSNSEAGKAMGFVSGVGSIVMGVQALSMGTAGMAAMGMSCVMPAIGIVAGICSIIGAFGDDGDEEAFAHALMQISEQIHTFKTQVMDRFDSIETMLDESHRKIMNSFCQLHLQSADIKNKILELKRDTDQKHNLVFNKLQQLRRESITQNKELFDQFATIHMDKVSETISNIRHEVASGKVDHTNFANKVHELFNCITITSRNSSLTGSASTNVAEKLSTDDILAGHSHPAFSNINLVKNFYEKRFGRNLGDSVVNPHVFVQCIRALIDLVENVDIRFISEKERAACIQDIAFIARQAQQVIYLVDVLADKTFVQELINDCKTSVTKLQTLTSQTRQKANKDLQEVDRKRVIEIQNEDIGTLRTLPRMNFDNLESIFHASIDVCGDWYKYKPEHKPNGESAASRISSLLHGDSMPCLYRGRPVKNSDLYAKMRQLCATRDWSNCFRDYCSAKPSCDNLKAILQPFVEQQKLQYQQAIQNNIQKIGSQRCAGQPASLLIQPHPKYHSTNKHPLVCESIKVDVYYIKAEQMGLGTIKHFYSCSGNGFLVDTVFFMGNHNYHTAPYEGKNGPPSYHIARTIIGSYEMLTSNDEDVISFWHGGTYCKKGDIFSNTGGYSGKCLMPDISQKYRPMSAKFTSSPKTVYNQGLDQIKALVDQRVHSKESEEVQKSIQLAQTPGNEVYNSLQQLDETSKILQAVSVLALNQDFDGSEVQKTLSSSVTKDRTSLLQRMQKYSGGDTASMFNGSQQYFDTLQTELGKVEPDFKILKAIVARLQNIIPYIQGAPVFDNKQGLEARVQTLSDEQVNLRREIGQIRGDMQQMNASMTEGFAQIMALLKMQK